GRVPRVSGRGPGIPIGGGPLRRQDPRQEPSAVVLCTLGSARGAARKGGPYRDRPVRHLSLSVSTSSETGVVPPQPRSVSWWQSCPAALDPCRLSGRQGRRRH